MPSPGANLWKGIFEKNSPLLTIRKLAFIKYFDEQNYHINPCGLECLKKKLNLLIKARNATPSTSKYFCHFKKHFRILSVSWWLHKHLFQRLHAWSVVTRRALADRQLSVFKTPSLPLDFPQLPLQAEGGCWVPSVGGKWRETGPVLTSWWCAHG